MRWLMIILIVTLWLLPAPCWAQEFQFRQEFDTIPVEINGWHPFAPWVGGLSRSIPAVADIDSDSDIDLLVGDYIGNLNYFRNDGNYQNADYHFITSSFDSIRLYYDSNPCFKDLDGDGDLDLLISDNFPHVLFYNNIGTIYQPTLIFVDSILTTGPPWCRAPELVDIDADGDYDLFGGSYGNISFYRNIGNSQTFNFYLNTGTFNGINVGSRAVPEFVDIDNDADMDLFVGNQSGNIYFYRNDGTPQQYNFTFVTNNYAGINVGGYASPEFADLDGDGDYDLLVGREQPGPSLSPGDIFYYQNTGTAQQAQWELVTKNYICLDAGNSANSATTDIDADADRDLFIQLAGYYLSYYKNIGSADSAIYEWITDNYQNVQVSYAYPKFGDLDSDGDPDLLMGEATIPGPPGLYLFGNRGTPQTASFSLYSSNLVPGVFTQSTVTIVPTLADIDNDNDLDLFVGVGDTHFYYFKNTGSPFLPQFTMMSGNWQNVYPSNWSSGQLIPEFYDIDNDGDLDLFCGGIRDWNQLLFYRNVGTSYNAQMVFADSTFLGEGFHVFTGVDIFDIDGDGDGDFMLSTGNGGMVFFRNITGESPVHPDPKRPAPTHPVITLLPNPGNSSIAASYELRAASKVSLKVFDITGRLTGTLFYGFQLPGTYSYTWDAAKKAAGVYLVRLEAGEKIEVSKAVVVK
jgi:hypothetical protein